MRMRVLYVEDNVLLRSAAVRFLSKEYDVSTVGNGRDALDLITKQDFDAVVSDVEIPYMNGVELHAQVAQVKPELAAKFIFVSGGMDREIAEVLEALPNQLLMKPFRFQDLGEALRALTA